MSIKTSKKILQGYSLLIGEGRLQWNIFKRFFNFSQKNTLRSTENGFFLDLGGGEGIWSLRIRPLVKVMVVMDLDKNAIRELQKEVNAKQMKNVFLIVGDINHIPLKNRRCSKILCREVIEHIQNVEVAFREMNRVLTDRGILVISTPNASYIRQYSFPLTKFIRSLIPEIYLRRTSFFGDLAKYGYDEWKKIVGHVRDGFTVSELEKLSDSSGFELEELTFIHKGICIYFAEMGGVLPFLRALFLPMIFVLEHIYEGEGLNITVKLKKKQESL